ncbi:sensor histidine kinase [Halobellus marinus]|uniref:sensor histidine kinase n=1 Tax=Halobellus TaxID=1073986 RepID=UPI0028B0F2D4|nr:HAMP domain-containing sensor histidine kinase [Halobellus sp. DFY28]
MSTERWPYAIAGTGALLSLTLVGELFVYVSVSGMPYSGFPIGILTSVPFVIGLVYGGYWLADSELPSERYDQVGRWWVGGTIGMILLVLVVNIQIQPLSTILVVGTVRWSAAIGGGAGLLMGILQAQAILRGIEAEKARKQRQQAERERDNLEEFTRIVSHDLQNPLHVAQGNLELLREDCESPRIDTIERAHDRMSTIIERTLTLARASRPISETGPVDLAAVAERSWEMIESADATLQREGTQTICADSDALQHLFENVFRNAIEHGGDEVTVRVGVLETGAGFYVEDDGPGIPDADREQVFESGYSTAPENLGFGLSIVRRVVQRHEWEITVGENDDGGARFEIRGVETPDD